MSETTKVEPKKEKQKTFTAEEFTKEYQTLCERSGFRIVVNPAWIPRDDGSWSIVLQMSIRKLKKDE